MQANTLQARAIARLHIGKGNTMQSYTDMGKKPNLRRIAFMTYRINTFAVAKKITRDLRNLGFSNECFATNGYIRIRATKA